MIVIRTIVLLFASFVSIVTFGSSTANAVSIDFGPSVGAPGFATQLTNQLQGLGVVFSSSSRDGVVWGDNLNTSYAYVIFTGFTESGFGDTSSIRIDFLTAASRVSIQAFDGGGDLDTVILRGFDLAGSESSSRSIGPASFAFPGERLEIASAEGFQSVVLETTGTTSGVFFDDLDFDVVPEPGTGLLVGMGIAILSQRNRRAGAFHGSADWRTTGA